MIPMSLLEIGTSAIIESLSLSKGLIHRLIDLGIKPGTRFSVLIKNKDLVIKINEAKIAIDKTLCQNIIVSVINAYEYNRK